jgi:hypothetical protein
VEKCSRLQQNCGCWGLTEQLSTSPLHQRSLSSKGKRLGEILDVSDVPAPAGPVAGTKRRDVSALRYSVFAIFTEFTKITRFTECPTRSKPQFILFFQEASKWHGACVLQSRCGGRPFCGSGNTIVGRRPVHNDLADSVSQSSGQGAEEEANRTPTMSCRIDRVVTADNLVVLFVSGRITGEDVDILRDVLQQEASGGFTIDLNNVLIVDREAVQLLALSEANGTELRNCPAYIREWITRERAAKRKGRSDKR